MCGVFFAIASLHSKRLGNEQSALLRRRGLTCSLERLDTNARRAIGPRIVAGRHLEIPIKVVVFETAQGLVAVERLVQIYRFPNLPVADDLTLLVPAELIERRREQAISGPDPLSVSRARTQAWVTLHNATIGRKGGQGADPVASCEKHQPRSFEVLSRLGVTNHRGAHDR